MYLRGLRLQDLLTHQNESNMTIKAPYNFVPFNDMVVTPEWIHQISHDVPFKEGLSGSLEIEIRAETPIFVRDGIASNGDDQGGNTPHRFSQYNNQFFIPGTSIKGMVRNVLEILSFGRMADRVNDDRYALRDLSGSMKDEYLSNFKPDSIYCGWLEKDMQTNRYRLYDCGHPGRISHKELDKKAKTKFSEYFTSKEKFKPKKDYEKSAQRKYDLFGREKSLDYSFAFTKDSAGRKIYVYDNQGNEKGALVFTGQPGLRQLKGEKWTGHHLEFIFFDQKGQTPVDVPSKVMADFLFAYFDGDKNKWSEDWKVWRKKLNEGHKIPVFFLKDGGAISSLGLSYLFKLPFKNSVGALLSGHKDKRDLSDAIFGFTDKEDALKGRVHIGHAFASETFKAEEASEAVSAVLGSPKASYFPNYIRQNVNRGGKVSKYKTYMDAGAKIAGWKRYPVRKDIQNGGTHADDNNENIKTRFFPLKAGAIFESKIQYHNLLPVELGALLSALTFHGSDDVWYSLGMGKPLGYGKVSLKVSNINEDDKKAYLGAFEAYMNAKLGFKEPTWHESEQVAELITMAKDQANQGHLAYVGLKDHVDAKTAKEALPKYSQLNEVKRSSASSFCSGQDITDMLIRIERAKKTTYNPKTLKDGIEARENAMKEVLLKGLEEKKTQLLQELQSKLEKIESDEQQAQRQLKREKASANALETGPDWSSLDPKHRDAFSDLKKIIEKWAREAYKQSDIKNIPGVQQGGYLPGEYHQSLLDVLQQVYDALRKKEQENWQKPFDKNPALKKVAEWIGEEQAKGIKFK